MSQSVVNREVMLYASEQMSPQRQVAGTEPLPVGHPLAWSAISCEPFKGITL